MQILDVRWFCGRATVGVVRVLDPYEGIKYYIGTGWGQDEKTDTTHIAEHGSTFDMAAGDVLFGVDEVKNGNAVPVPMNREYAESMVRVGMFYLDQHGQAN